MDRSRPALVEIANDLRAKGGASVIVERLVEEARVSGADACIESVRTVGEARALLACGATLLAVDADQEARFERVQGRNSATDQVGWEEFQADEASHLYFSRCAMRERSASASEKSRKNREKSRKNREKSRKSRKIAKNRKKSRNRERHTTARASLALATLALARASRKIQVRRHYFFFFFLFFSFFFFSRSSGSRVLRRRRRAGTSGWAAGWRATSRWTRRWARTSSTA